MTERADEPYITIALEKPERQTEAIKLQQTWSIWLVTVQTTVLAVIGATVFHEPNAVALERWADKSLAFGVFCSCVSIIAASFIASAHPSMVLRIKPNSEHLNIRLWNSKYAPKSLPIVIVEHYAFLISVVCYGFFLIVGVLHLGKAACPLNL